MNFNKEKKKVQNIWLEAYIDRCFYDIRGDIPLFKYYQGKGIGTQECYKTIFNEKLIVKVTPNKLKNMIEKNRPFGVEKRKNDYVFEAVATNHFVELQEKVVVKKKKKGKKK